MRENDGRKLDHRTLEALRLRAVDQRVALTRLMAVSSYVLVLVLTVQCALWGAFLVPLRVSGMTAPISALFAAGNAPLIYAGRRVAQARWGGVVPALLWLALVLRLGNPSANGSIVIEATATGYAFLLIGTVAAVVGLAVPPGYNLGPGRRPGGQ